MLAVSGAYASNKFAPIFYAAGDVCTGSGDEPEPCPPSNNVACVEDGTNLQYYYRPNGIGSQCTALLKD